MQEIKRSIQITDNKYIDFINLTSEERKAIQYALNVNQSGYIDNEDENKTLTAISDFMETYRIGDLFYSCVVFWAASRMVNVPNTGVNGTGGNLKFGADDLVYGPSSGGKLRELADQAGGKLLTDLGSPSYNIYGKTFKDWNEFSKYAMNQALKNKSSLRFDLTNMEDIQGVLSGTAHEVKQLVLRLII